MPGVCIPGRFAKLEISGDGGLSYVNFGGIVDVTLNINIDELECTTHDSDGVRDYMPNHSDFGLETSCRWEDGDPGQEIVQDAIDNKGTLLFKFYMQRGAGKKVWEGSCFPTTGDVSGPLDDTAGFDVNFRCSGVSRTVQTAP